jgi:hypothetical protein
MRESSTYQAILAEGAVEEARKVLRLVGDDAFGPPDVPTVAQLQQLDLPRLEEMLKRLRTAGSWQELLGPLPNPRRRSRRSSS